jgi:phage head maturation protease
MKNNFKLDSIKQFINLDGEDLNDLVVRKGYLKESQLKISDEDERTILADISTQDVDSDGDIVLAKGCDLNRYLKNPIITINHSYITQDIVGSTKQIEVLDDRIRCKIKLNDTDSALNLWKQVRAGDIRGNSIGFVIKEAVIKGTKEFDTIQKMYNLKTNDAKRIITKYLLIENSIVALPANPDALNVEVSKKSLDIETAQLEPAQLAIEEKTLNIDSISEVAKVAEVAKIEEVIEQKSIPQVLIIERLGGLDIKQMYEDYKSGKII